MITHNNINIIFNQPNTGKPINLSYDFKVLLQKPEKKTHLTKMDKELLKLLKKVRNYNEVEPIIFSIYPNYKKDFAFKKAMSLLKNDKFQLLEFREKILGHSSIYSEVVMKTAHELSTLKIKATPSTFNRYFRANWIDKILHDNIAELFADPFLPTITFTTLESYIKDLKTGKNK